MQRYLHRHLTTTQHDATQHQQPLLAPRDRDVQRLSYRVQSTLYREPSPHLYRSGTEIELYYSVVGTEEASFIAIHRHSTTPAAKHADWQVPPSFSNFNQES